MNAARDALRRPAALVAATVLLICVPVRAGAGGTEFGPGDLASAVLVVVAGITAVRDGRRLSRPTVLLVAGVVLAASVVAVAGRDTSASLSGWIRYLQLFALTPLAVVLAVRTRRDAALVAGAVVAAAVGQGAVGVVQYTTRTGASYAGEPVRAVGTFGATDVIAMSVVVGLGLTLCAGATLAGPRRRRLAAGLAAAALLVPLGLSLSRGSWIATAVALVVVAALAGRRTFALTAVAATAAVTVLVGGFGIGSGVVGERLGSMTSAPDSSMNDRYALWGTAVDMWAEHPATGVGLKAFPRFRDAHAPLSLNSGSDIDQVGLGYRRQELLSPHNQYLLVLAEQGAVGFVPFLALVGGTALAALRATRAAGPAGRGLGAGITGLAAWQLAQFAYGDLGGASSLLTSVIIGLAAWWGWEHRGPARPGPARDAGDPRVAVPA